MKKYILTLDQGTTGSRAIIFDKKGNIIAQNHIENTLIYPKQGWVECDANLLWETQKKAMEKCLENIQTSEIASMGITNQRETTIIWDKNTGIPLYNAIIWQCRRTASICEQLNKSVDTKHIKEATGLLIDPYFSATKIKWIFDNFPKVKKKAQNGEVCFGTVDTWLLWKLTKGKVHATDYSNASRTMLFNINTLEWDEKILDMLDIPKSILPEVKDTSSLFGEFNTGNESIPITSMVGDQQAALFGQTCFDEGDIKNTYGTGCFILCNTKDKMIVSKNRLLTTIGWKFKDEIVYALEGSIFNTGSAIKWLRDEMQMIKTAKECDELAESVKDNNGVYFVPAFTGLGAPHWDMHARGTITGIARNSGREHIARAVLESIAFQTQDVLLAMKKDSGIDFNTIYADGGASKSNFLMQFQSDISNMPLVRPKNTESTALGAAFLSGLYVNFWKNKTELKQIHMADKKFEPSMSLKKRNAYKKNWENALKCAKGFAKDE